MPFSKLEKSVQKIRKDQRQALMTPLKESYTGEIVFKMSEK
jgi:hypothetical protein